MKPKELLAVIILGGNLAIGNGVRADDTTDAINQLKQQIDALNQKVLTLEQQQQAQGEEQKTLAKQTPTVVIGNNGLSARSADSNFVIQLHGQVQVDSRTFFHDLDNHGKSINGTDGFLLRRARPIFSGTVYRDFDFMFVPDFAGSTPQIFDAYINYRYAPWLQIRGGKFKSPVGLEQLQNDANILFNERSLATDLVPNRDLGFELWGDVADGRLSYAAGVFNGVGDARNSSNAAFDNHAQFDGRLFLQPFKDTGLTPLQGLGFGVAGSWGNTYSNASGLPSAYLTDGQQTFFAYTNNAVANGTHWRLSPQGYYYWGPLGLMSEYVISDQEVRKSAKSAALDNTAWEVTGSWVLTGENAGFDGVTPAHPFDPRAGHWGAVQVAGRFAQLNIDDSAFPVFANPATSASEATAWAAGLNWYLNRNIKVAASFSHTTFEGNINPTQATVTRQSENVVFTRVQLAF